jgi:hypothetical protein
MGSFVNFKNINPKLNLLCESFHCIHEEYLKNKEKLEFKDFSKKQEYSIGTNKKGHPITPHEYLHQEQKKETSIGWHISALYGNNIEYHRNTQYLPILSQTLKEINYLYVCAINLLDPSYALDWHNDSDYFPNMSTMRILWGLDVPEEDNRYSLIHIKDSNGVIETKKFKNNEFYIFLPQFTHKVENTLSQSRSLLCIDAFVGN